MAIPVLNAAQMQRIDRYTIDEIGIPGTALMESAGRAVAEAAEGLLPESGRVLVLCGKGNNGGDGFVAARHLQSAGHEVRCALLCSPERLQGDAASNARIAACLKIPMDIVDDEDAIDALDWESQDLLVDALFGTGLNSPVQGLVASLLARANACPVPVLAVDLPSGLCADTGKALGSALRADLTVTFGAPKKGQLLFPGSELCGDLHVADIGFPPQAFDSEELKLWLLCEHDVADYVQRRDTNSHKGDFGHLLVLAGSAAQPGAAGLAVQAALRGGAGLVSLAAAGSVLERVIVGPCEAMGVEVEDFKAFQAACVGKTAMAIGPGLGRGERIAELVRRAAAEVALPAVLDADGLNLLVGETGCLLDAPAERVLTPHPGEMARLLDTDTASVQADRIGAARQLAQSCRAVVVLKGAHSIVADAEGQAFIVPTGNAGMATGGSGDVLTGLLGAFLAEGLGALEAACVATYCHGLAGDAAALAGSQRALKAGDIIQQLPAVFGRFEGADDLEEDGDEP